MLIKAINVEDKYKVLSINNITIVLNNITIVLNNITIV